MSFVPDVYDILRNHLFSGMFLPKKTRSLGFSHFRTRTAVRTVNRKTIETSGCVRRRRTQDGGRLTVKPPYVLIMCLSTGLGKLGIPRWFVRSVTRYATAYRSLSYSESVFTTSEVCKRISKLVTTSLFLDLRFLRFLRFLTFLLSAPVRHWKNFGIR